MTYESALHELRALVSTYLEGSDDAARAAELLEMLGGVQQRKLCEQTGLVLRAGPLYRFVEDPSCGECLKLAMIFKTAPMVEPGGTFQTELRQRVQDQVVSARATREDAMKRQGRSLSATGLCSQGLHGLDAADRECDLCAETAGTLTGDLITRLQCERVGLLPAGAVDFDLGDYATFEELSRFALHGRPSARRQCADVLNLLAKKGR